MDNIDYDSLIPDIEKTKLKKIKNDIYLSDAWIEILERYDIDYRKYNLSERMMNFYNLRNPRSSIDLDWVKKNSVIIHYCGRMKPWKGKYIGCLDCFYRELEK